MVQAWQDQNKQFKGSDRMFFSGCGLTSGTAWNWMPFSGTNTGFGTHSNEEGNRFSILSSGASVAQLSFNSGLSIHADVYPGDELTFDGVSRSGCWLRTNTGAAKSQVVRVWSW